MSSAPIGVYSSRSLLLIRFRRLLIACGGPLPLLTAFGGGPLPVLVACGCGPLPLLITCGWPLPWLTACGGDGPFLCLLLVPALVASSPAW